MPAECNPAKLPNLGTDLVEHFQLPQCCIRSLPVGVCVPFPDGRFLVSIPVEEATEFNKSTFVRLSREWFRDLEDSQLKILRQLCKAAHPSEEFFVTDATNQWLRTTIKSVGAPVDLLSLELTKEQRRMNTIIHSNVLPYDPYWSRPMPRSDEPSIGVHFPCRIVKEAHKDGKTLTRKLIEWRQESDSIEKCDIGKHQQEGGNKKFWEVVDNVVTVRLFAPSNEFTQVSLIKWRDGNFIKKETKFEVEFDAEVIAMKRLCHPHIVYIFGINHFDGVQGSLFMECMESDLLTLILDKRQRPEGGEYGPSFLHYNSVDILLQIAKAMVHMHENEVIHGDLKSPNILVSKFGSHYLAKVADFGSARVKVKSFEPGPGSTFYGAPEVFEFFENKKKVISAPENIDVYKKKVISVPENIDVYSFGVIAFEVLTGVTMENVCKDYKYPREVKQDVMKGNLKPPLREECQKVNFLKDDRLLSLIERCWRGESDPSGRPSFSEIVEVLNRVKVQILEATAQSDGPSGGASLVQDSNSIAPEINIPVPSASVLLEVASRSNGDPSSSLNQASNTSAVFGEQESVPSGSNGLHPQSLTYEANNTIVQVPRSRRRRNPLKKFLSSFSCMSGGKVQK